MSEERKTLESMNYRQQVIDELKCCASCGHFASGLSGGSHECDLVCEVLAPIDPLGVCDEYQRFTP